MHKLLKLHLFATVMAIAVPYAGLALAADVAPAGNASDWTGFYVGAQFGGGAVVNNIELPGLGSGNFNGIGGEGVLGSAMAGYNLQMNDIVFGLQGEVGYNNLITKLNIPGLATIDAHQGLVAAISARAGLLLTPDTLAYAIGGYSYSEYRTDTSFLGNFDERYNGFHVGGGLETKISPNATIRVEYRYTKYNAKDWGTGGFVNVEPSTHTGTVGLTYSF